MQITEAARHHMIDRLEATLGSEAAMTLAEHLPPGGWSDVARRSDVEQVRIDLGRDIEQVRIDLGKDIEQVRIDLGKDIDRVRSDLGKDIQSCEDRVVATLHRELRTQTWAFVGTLLTLAGLVMAALRLFGT